MTAPALPRDEQYDAFGNPVKAKAKPDAPTLSLATGTKSEAGAPSPYANIVPQGAPGGQYLGQTIQPGAGVDRVGLAQKAWETNVAQSAPAYEASLRQAKQQAAGVGQLGSGQLRTSLGDLSLQRQRDMDADRQRLMNEAITGSIADQYKNIDVAQQQQQFQAAQQTTDFQQQLAREQAGLARALGLGNLGVSQQQADTQRMQATGQLGLSREQLAQQERMQAAGFAQESAQSKLAREQQSAMQQAGFTQEQIEAQKAREQQTSLALAEREFESSQADKQRALQERMQQTGLDATSAQAQLDREQQSALQQAQLGQETEQARLAREQQAAQFGQTLSLDQQRQAAQESQFAAAQEQELTLAEKNRQLQETMQQTGLDATAAQALLDRQQQTTQAGLDRTQQLDLAKRAEAEALLERQQQTALQGAQFGQETEQNRLARKQQAEQFKDAQTLDRERLALEDKVRSGQLTVQEATQKLDELRLAQQKEQFGQTLRADLTDKNLFQYLNQILGIADPGSTDPDKQNTTDGNKPPPNPIIPNKAGRF